VKANFPTTCEVCHKASDPGWTGATFNHGSVFPLVGVHKTLACNQCHKNGVYAGTPRHCYGCHKADYDQTTNPNHVKANFPTTCEVCHKASDANWNQAKFNHASVFPLVGKHATARCSDCHKNGVYAGTPRNCYGCHKTEYQQTTNPNHQAAGFPTTCDACHRAGDTSWLQGRFTHTWFPIQSGKHAGIPCSTCHTNPSDYKVFQCLSCHPRSQVDPQHQGVGGYVYTSQACYNCHPTGQGD
jgi:nitrate/TMAO reductase-like tetraheme cytochrome c subunit